MQRVFKLIFPFFAVALAVAAALVSVYPFGESVETRPVTILKPYTETMSEASTIVKRETSAETYYKTVLRTEVIIVTEAFTTIRSERRTVKVHYSLPGLMAGDTITLEAGPQVRVWVVDHSGEYLAESDNGELSYVVVEAGEYVVWFEAEGLKENREVFIGVSRPGVISTETRIAYTTYKWSTTIVERYTRTKALASTIYTYNTILKPAPLTQRIWLTACLIVLAASLAIASVLLWRFEPKIEVSPYEGEQRNFEENQI